MHVIVLQFIKVSYKAYINLIIKLLKSNSKTIT